MSPRQVEMLYAFLEKVTNNNQSYTITGADDWDLVVGTVGFFCVLIGAMWRHLITAMSANKESTDRAVREVKSDIDRDIDNVWKGMRECKDDCCEALQKGKGKD